MGDVARLSSAHIARLPPRVALYLQASIVVAFLAASSAPTPLYAVYQSKWGFTPITITAVFGIYALAVLAALLTVGSLSDYVGRRPVLLVAIVIQAAGLVGPIVQQGTDADVFFDAHLRKNRAFFRDVAQSASGAHVRRQSR